MPSLCDDSGESAIAIAKGQEAHPNFHPFGFVSLGRGNSVEQMGRDGSYVNRAEAMVIIAYVKDIIKKWPKKAWRELTFSDICIVSSEYMQVLYTYYLQPLAGFCLVFF